MAKKKSKTMTTKKVVKAEKKKPENKELKAKPENKGAYKGYVMIDGLMYKVSEAKAEQLVKKGVARY